MRARSSMALSLRRWSRQPSHRSAHFCGGIVADRWGEVHEELAHAVSSTAVAGTYSRESRTSRPRACRVDRHPCSRRFSSSPDAAPVLHWASRCSMLRRTALACFSVSSAPRHHPRISRTVRLGAFSASSRRTRGAGRCWPTGDLRPHLGASLWCAAPAVPSASATAPQATVHVQKDPRALRVLPNCTA